MTAIIAYGTLGTIAFLLSVTSIIFSFMYDKEGLFDRYLHWVRPLLFLAGIAWLVVMLLVGADANVMG